MLTASVHVEDAMNNIPGRRVLMSTTLVLSVLMSLTAMAQTDAKTYQLVPPDPPSAPIGFLDMDLAYVMNLWSGEFDNREQVQFDTDGGKKDVAGGGHPRIHSFVARANVPALGSNVLYVEEYRDNDPSKIFRQRLYSVGVDKAAKAIRVKLHFFKDGKAYLGAHRDPAKLKGITAADVSSLDGCDLLLTRDADAIVGSMKPKACVFGEEGKKRYADYRVRLSKDQYWFSDRTRDAVTDALLEPAVELSPFVMERARPFVCMIDFPITPGKPQMRTDAYVAVNDQGGTYPFKHPDGRDMVMTLRNNWSYGMQRETLVVVVQERDERGPTLSYGWSQGGADRIGVNPEWMRVQCDLDTPENRKAQQDLRPDS